MELERWFKNLRFSEEALRRAASALRDISECKYGGTFRTLEIAYENNLWKYDEVEDFFADLSKAEGVHLYYWMTGKNELHYSLQYDTFGPEGSSVRIKCSTR
jgi:hypothetical protein